MKLACAQRPNPGETIKMNFDLFPPPSTSTSVSPSVVIVTVTSPLLDSPPSQAVLATTSSSTTIVKTAHDSNVLISVGAGVGAGSGLTILAVVYVIFARRRFNRRRKSEEKSRATPESRHLADAQIQVHDHQRRELGSADGMVEAEAKDGTNHVPMLDGREVRMKPGTSSRAVEQ